MVDCWRCMNRRSNGIEYANCLQNFNAMKKVILIALILVGATTNAQNFVDAAPEWFNNPPTSNKKFYGVGLGMSKSMEIAESKATMQANLHLAEQVVPPKTREEKLSYKSKDGKISEETIQRKIVEAQLTDVVIVKKAFMQDGDNYLVYVLVEMKKKKK